RGFLFSEHRELSEVTRAASEEYAYPPLVRLGVPSSPPEWQTLGPGSPGLILPGLLVGPADGAGRTPPQRRCLTPLHASAKLYLERNILAQRLMKITRSGSSSSGTESQSRK